MWGKFLWRLVVLGFRERRDTSQMNDLNSLRWLSIKLQTGSKRRIRIWLASHERVLDDMVLIASWFMWTPASVLDLVREARYWFVPVQSSCPWGLIFVALISCCLLGCCCGCILTGITLSKGCRLVLFQWGAAIVNLWTAGPILAHTGAQVRRRFLEYRAWVEIP